MLTVMKPKLPSLSQVSKYIESIDSSRIYSNRGPLVIELESRYGEYFGICEKRIVCVANATLAIQGCIGLSLASKWYVPDYTFPATILAVINSLKEVCLTDVNQETWKIDLDLIEEIACEKTEFGVLPVIPFGANFNLTEYSNFEHIVIDAAASISAPPVDLASMPSSWFIVFSLHATKVLGCGEGAVVICGNENSANLLRSWSNFGFAGSRVPSLVGTNAKMSELSAAYALTSLEFKDIEFAEWRSHLDYINQCDYPSRFRTFLDLENHARPYWLIRCRDQAEISNLEKFMFSHNIETRRWWPKALHEIDYFKHFPFFKQSELNDANSNTLASTILGLPLYRDIGRANIDKVSNLLLRYEVLSQFSK
jgi:dTDP-4-amino-4,6-dideoxygalactose transaminase